MLTIFLSLFAVLSNQPAIGDKAPMFFLKTLEGADYYLRDYVGEPRPMINTPRKHVLLSFYASWCAPCRKEIPELQAMVSRIRSDELNVFFVNVGEEESIIKKTVRDLKLAHPVIMDIYGTVAARYCQKDQGGLVKLPTVALIGKDGIIRFIHSGYEEGVIGQLEKEIHKLFQS